MVLPDVVSSSAFPEGVDAWPFLFANLFAPLIDHLWSRPIFPSGRLARHGPVKKKTVSPLLLCSAAAFLLCLLRCGFALPVALKASADHQTNADKKRNILFHCWPSWKRAGDC